LLVWALASIYTVTTQPGVDAFIAYSNIPLPVNSGSTVNCGSTSDQFDCGTQSAYYSYLYAIAYPVIVALAFASWVGAEVSQNAYKSNWIAYRSMLFGLTALCFDFFAPLCIYVAREVNSATLNSANLAIAAGVFILTGATLLWLISALWHYFSLPIPVPDRTVTVMTKDIQLNSVAVDPVNKVGEAARAAAIGSGTMYATDVPATSTYPAATTYPERSYNRENVATATTYPERSYNRENTVEMN